MCRSGSAIKSSIFIIICEWTWTPWRRIVVVPVGGAGIRSSSVWFRWIPRAFAVAVAIDVTGVTR